MAKIVVVGSMNMDIVSRVEMHPKPGQTIKGNSTQYLHGGKGANQAVAASLSGGNVTMMGAVGNDSFGEELIKSLHTHGIQTDGIVMLKGTSGTAFITVDASGENTIILSEGTNGAFSPEYLRFGRVDCIEDATVVLLQNEIPWETSFYAVKEARRRGIKVYLNPAPIFGIPDDVYPMIDLLILNESEAGFLAGRAIGDANEAEMAARTFIEKGARAVIVTLGKEGSIFVAASGRPISTPAFQVQPVDTTAAGDAFIGAFAVANETMPVEEALLFATAAAALTVSRIGAQQAIPDRQEILDFMEHDLKLRNM